MNQPTSIDEIKDWIETSLDNDAHGKWVRAPKFEIIQDVAELLAPRFVEKLTTLVEQARVEMWQEFQPFLARYSVDRPIPPSELRAFLGEFGDAALTISSDKK